MAKSKKSTEQAQMTHALSLIGGLGVTMVACIGVGFAVGYAIDKFAGTQPVFLLVFLFVGVAAGMIRVYQMVMKSVE